MSFGFVIGICAEKEDLGLNSFKGMFPTKQESEIAKNYLSVEELNILNRMVTAYLEIAEIQVLNRTPMYMNDWIKQLDTFLQLTGKEILQHAGTVSHKDAIEKAHLEYEKYKKQIGNQVSKIELDFLKHIEIESKNKENKH